LGQKEKLILRLKSRPKDFTFDEAVTLLRYLEYNMTNKGKTSGSRVRFDRENYKPIFMHKPHPRNTLIDYQVNELIRTLRERDLI